MLSEKTREIIKSTVPVLEVHGETITRTFYKNMFEAHPELLNIFNQANQKKGRQQAALANSVLAAAKNIDNLGAIIPVVKQIGHKHRSLAIKPEHYPIVGENLLKAIKEVLGDAATDEIINAWADAYGVIADVFIDVEKNMYKEVEEQPGGWTDYKEFTVIEKVVESDVITSFYLKPVDGVKVPNYLPGQYITVRIQIPGEQYLFNRQYSLSAAPGKDYYRISVKKEAVGEEFEGIVSNYLHNAVNIGDTVEVTAPAGDFILNGGSTPVVFLAGGVGVTPLLSMVQEISNKQPNRSVQFIHGTQNGKVQAFKEELTNISLEDYSLQFVYSAPTEEDKQNAHFVKEGLIDNDLLEKVLDDQADYYICGPVDFMKSTIINLKKLGIKDEKIHYEFFGPAMAINA